MNAVNADRRIKLFQPAFVYRTNYNLGDYIEISGRLEIKDIANNNWGTVCSDYFTSQNNKGGDWARGIVDALVANGIFKTGRTKTMDAAVQWEMQQPSRNSVVACRHLGYSSANAGVGKDLINVQPGANAATRYCCRGTEATLHDCSQRGSCNHSQDVGLTCRLYLSDVRGYHGKASGEHMQ